MTDQVRGALAGVTVTDTAVCESARAVTTESGYAPYNMRAGDKTRAIEVTYRHGKTGRGRVVFYDRCPDKDSHRILWWQSVAPWAAKQRDNRAKPKAVKLSRQGSGDCTADQAAGEGKV